MGIPLPDSGSVTEDSGEIGGYLTASGDVDYWFGSDAGQWTAETIAGSYGGALVIDANGVWVYTALNDHAAISALNDGETLTEVFTVTSANGTTTVTITINGSTDPPCFVQGSLIDTPQGARSIETLSIGDWVLTRDMGAQQIKWLGASVVDTRRAEFAHVLRPIRICAGAFGSGVPQQDVLISPMHRVLAKGPAVSLMFAQSEVLCTARHLVNGHSIVQEPSGVVVYYHLLFEQHQIVTGAGLISESFFPGPVGLDRFEDGAREELFLLFPQLRSMPESYGQAARRILKGYEAELLGETLTVDRPKSL